MANNENSNDIEELEKNDRKADIADISDVELITDSSSRRQRGRLHSFWESKSNTRGFCCCCSRMTRCIAASLGWSYDENDDATDRERKISWVTGEPLSSVKQVVRNPKLSQRL